MKQENHCRYINPGSVSKHLNGVAGAGRDGAERALVETEEKEEEVETHCDAGRDTNWSSSRDGGGAEMEDEDSCGGGSTST